MTNHAPRTRRKRLRRGFVCLLLLLPPAWEGLVRLLVPAESVAPGDPFVSFASVQPLFRITEDGTAREIAPERLPYFRPQSFPVPKPPDTTRIFVLGGSTVQGRPYAVETSFPTWLRLGLEAMQPEHRWEVINAGGISYASYRLVPILREILGYEADAVVLCTGHNEFLEDRTYAHWKQASPLRLKLHNALCASRTYALLNRWLHGRPDTPVRPAEAKHPRMPTEVRARLDYREGLQAYHRDDDGSRVVEAHFRHNLHTMASLVEARGIPLILILPPANLRDCPPFKSESTPGKTDDDAQHVTRLRRQAETIPWKRVEERIPLLEQAVKRDPRHAGLLFTLGTACLHANRRRNAEHWLERALEEDVCPLRMPKALRNAVGDLAAQHRIPLLDAQALLAAEAECSIPGNDVLLDHVHPTIDAHKRIADALLEICVNLELVRPRPSWEEQCRRKRWEHTQALPPTYFAHGRKTLERLTEWSRGRLPPGADARELNP